MKPSIQPVKNAKHIEFHFDSLQAATRSLRFMFLMVVLLSLIVSYAIFQQPWWIAEKVSDASDVVEPFLDLHADIQKNNQIREIFLKRYRTIRQKILEFLNFSAVFTQDNNALYEEWEKAVKAELPEQEIDFYGEMVDDKFFESFDKDLSIILNLNADLKKTELKYLYEFSVYFYPELWLDVANKFVLFLGKLDKAHESQIVTQAMGLGWDDVVKPENLQPHAILKATKAGPILEDKISRLPQKERFIQNGVILSSFCQSYQLFPCTFDEIKLWLEDKEKESVLRNINLPYLGGGVGNLQVILISPFVLLILFLMIYLQMRRRKIILLYLKDSGYQQDLALVDAPTIFSNIELFQTKGGSISEQAASLCLKAMIMIVFLFSLCVIGGCIYYVLQEVLFHRNFNRELLQTIAEWRQLDVELNISLREYRWSKMFGIYGWLLGAFLALIVTLATAVFIGLNLWQSRHSNVND